MKARSNHFLAEVVINGPDEVVDYIRELHDYLWRFVRVAIPGAGGDLTMFLDKAIDMLEQEAGDGKSSF